MSKKYNPCLNAIVQNYRDAAQKANREHAKHSNETLWPLIDEASQGNSEEENIDFFLFRLDELNAQVVQ